MSAVKDWRWFGKAAHFICGHMCRFHMATDVGEYLVSSVGEMWPERLTREIFANSRDPAWMDANRALRGDAFDYAYMKRFGYEEIGCDRKFETLVFRKKDGLCECGCGQPNIDHSEVDGEPSNDVKTAQEAHMALCAKWAKRK